MQRLLQILWIFWAYDFGWWDIHSLCNYLLRNIILKLLYNVVEALFCRSLSQMFSFSPSPVTDLSSVCLITYKMFLFCVTYFFSLLPPHPTFFETCCCHQIQADCFYMVHDIYHECESTFTWHTQQALIEPFSSHKASVQPTSLFYHDFMTAATPIKSKYSMTFIFVDMYMNSHFLLIVQWYTSYNKDIKVKSHIPPASNEMLPLNN